MSLPRRCMLLVFIFLLGTGSVLSRSTLLKNATLCLVDGTWQPQSYLIIRESKIAAVGKMGELEPAIFDREYDLEGKRVYPAFIDILRAHIAARKGERAAGQDAAQPRTGDKNLLPPFQERNILPGRKVVAELQISAKENRQAVSKGFAVLHLVPEKGIIGGRTASVSTAGDSPKDAVLSDDLFMHLAFKPNSQAYPGTYSTLAAEIRQMRADLEQRREIGKRQHLPGVKRLLYEPELTAMEPFLSGQRRFFVILENVVEQRLLEVLGAEMAMKPVVVLSGDFWRRPLPRSWQPVVKLSFSPGAASRDALLGEENRKKNEEETYPAMLADYVMKAAAPVLAPAASADYDGFFKNIRSLLKAGVSEAKIVAALTVNPARILGIADLFGSLEAGKTASLLVSAAPLFDEKGKVELAWVEGKLFDFSAEKRSGAKPALDLSGRWRVSIQSQMGSFDMTMTIEQQGNDFSATMVSQLGEISVEDGFISGSEISFSAASEIAGQALDMSFTGKAVGRRIEGRLTLGAMGEAALTAVPESD